MIAAWMLYCAATALLLAGAAAALERTVRLSGRSGRWVWIGAMLVTFGLPLAARYRPSGFPTVMVPLAEPNVASSVNVPPTTARSRALAAPASGFSWADLDRPLALVWGGLSLGLLGLGVIAAARLRRLRRGWRPATVDGTHVMISLDLGPAVVGVVRSHLVVPAWALELDSRKRELLLAHEREHIRAGDPRLLAAASLLLALMPWNLALWWQWRRLRLAIEMDCDARVLRRNPDRARYGDLLLEVSQRATRSLLPGTAFHEPMSLLERRIRAIASGRPKWLLVHAAGTAAVAAALMMASCEAPSPEDPTGVIASTEAVSSDSMLYVAPEPIYPPLLALAGIQGAVTVEAIIDTAGRVESNTVRILESPHPALTQSAKEAVLASRYHPARVNGKAVRALIRQRITFPVEGRATTGEPLQSPDLARLQSLVAQYQPEVLSRAASANPVFVAFVLDPRGGVVRHGVTALPTDGSTTTESLLLLAFPNIRISALDAGGIAWLRGGKNNPPKAGDEWIVWGTLRN